MVYFRLFHYIHGEVRCLMSVESARSCPRDCHFPAGTIVCVFLLALVLPLHARGAGEAEDSLSHIDALIDAKRFDEAMDALALYSRQYPQDLNRAGERLRRIAEIQSRYNSLIHRLLDLIARDPGDRERIFALAEELESLESPKDLRSGELLARVRRLTAGAANRKRLEEILAGGRELSGRGDYAGALGLYREGLLYQEESFARGPGDPAENPVRDRIRRLSVLIDALESSLAALDGAVEELGGASPEVLSRVYGRIWPELDALDRIRGEIGEAGAFFDGALRETGAAAEPAMEGGNFLSFVPGLIYGGDSGQGMLRIVEDCLAGRRRSLGTLLVFGAEEAYDRALAKARDRRYREAIEDYREAALRNSLARDFLERTGAPAGAPPILLYRDFVISCSIRAENLELLLDELIAGQTTAESPEPPGEGETGGEFKAGLRDLSSAGKVLTEELRDGGEAFLRRLGDQPGEPSPGAITRYTAGALELLENFRSRRLALELGSSLRRHTAFNDSLGERLERRKARLALADRLMGGLKRDEAAVVLQEAGAELPVFPEFPEDDGTLYYFSREALGIFKVLQAETGEDLGYAGEFFARYEEEREIQGSAELEALRASIGKILESLEDILRRGAGGAALAEERIGQAELFRAQGDRYYQEAQEAARRGDFTGARNSIQRAAERYGQSLSIQESSSLRQEWDTRMLALGQEIAQGENEVLVKDTRNAINQVRTEYLAGNFQQAENLLLQGQSRWRQANAEENPELSYWFSVVRDAISLRSGREIPVTAPLFAEMGQLLSEARRDYEEGAAFIRAGRRDEGLARFNAARQNIREVKFVFPENHEAGMLELRMDRIADPETFNALFRRRLDEALAGIKSRSTEALGDLQNLAEINPSHPGIAALLRQAEIDMGYRPAPPDPQKLRRSADLTEAARSIVDANDREYFGAALRQLNEALTLNPGNTQAMGLKDLVQTRMGTGNAVLSSADEGEYQRAVRELQRGNTLISMSIVNQLLRNPRNRASTRVLELQRRIQSFL
jgi:hypothetical protein